MPKVNKFIGQVKNLIIGLKKEFTKTNNRVKIIKDNQPSQEIPNIFAVSNTERKFKIKDNIFSNFNIN